MAKINQEEYEVLKELDDKWKWIARTESRVVKTFLSKPRKRLHWLFDGSGSWDIKGNENFGIYTNYADLFQFIQWEDEDPYNIAELIEEYEYHNEPVKLAGGLSITQAKYDKYLEEHIKELENESEEAEVKKDIEWLKEEITEVLLTSKKDGTNYFYYKDLKEKIYNAVDELDEPEVLSQEWVDEHAKAVTYDGIPDQTEVVYVDDLQNLLVPKQNLPVIPKFVADWVESRDYCNVYKVLQDLSAPGSPHASKDVRNWIFRNQENVEKFVRAWLDGYEVEKEQKYYVLSKELHPMLCESAGTDKKIMESITELTINEKGLYKEQYALTEQEIKDYDKRYWAFRKPIEELEE